MSACTLPVPAGTEALYGAADVWKEFNIAGSADEQEVVVDTTPPADDAPGYLVLRLAIPTDDALSGSFRVILPPGMNLDTEKTALSDALADRYALSVTPVSAGAWLLEIKPKTSTRSAQAGATQEIVKIAWTTDPSLPNGTYEVKISQLEFTVGDHTVIREDEIKVSVTVGGPSGNTTVEAPEEILYDDGVLSVRTPVSETVAVYSLSGAPVFRSEKASGQAVFQLRQLPQGVYIVRGGSGWTKKIVAQNG